MIFRFPSIIIVVFLLIAPGMYSQNGQPGKSWQSPEATDSLEFKNLDINSKYDDYAPVFINGTLYFTSSRKNFKTDEADLKYNQNIYSSIDKNNEWKNAAKHYFFNNDDFTALAGYSFEGPRIFIYKTFGNGDLYYSELNKKGKWTAPKRFKRPVNSGYNEQSIAWTDELIVISSNRPGNEKNKLYWAYNNPDQRKIEFSLLHPSHAEWDELDVSFASDGKTLYFSSNGRNSQGGFDIFYTEFDGKGNWSNPENMGPSVNTLNDERWFMNCDSMFFMSSNRPEGNGEFDIYLGHLIPKKKVVAPDTVVVEIIPPDTVSDPIETIKNYLDSSQFEVYVAFVQVGAFYFIKSVEDFKKKFEIFSATDIFVEKVNTERGVLHKYILDNEYKTLREAAVRQRQALSMQRENNLKNPNKLKEDAFIAVYNIKGERILIYFNVDTREYKILIGDKTVFF